MNQNIMQHLVLAFAILLFANSIAFAGPKLAKLKEDVQKIKIGTLLIAPIMEDSFVLRKLQGATKTEKLKAYQEAIADANANMKKAVASKYSFSKVEFLPPADNYQAYFEAFNQRDREKFFVLQFGQAVQYVEGKTKRIRAYDREILGIYEVDGSSRVYLNAGKINLFKGLTYAENIISSLDRNLRKYAKEKRKKSAEPAILLPKLANSVALLPQEKLFGNDSTTFEQHIYQTVVTVKPLTLYRVFGGKAAPNGTFAGTNPVNDTLKVREELAILPSWGNNFSFEAVVEVPVATKLQIGIAAAQPPLKGGGDQVILPYRWPLEWIKEVHSLKTKEVWSLEEFKEKHPEYFSK